MKKVALMVLGTAMQTYGDKLADEQEVLSGAADIIIDVYAAESVVLRAAPGAGRAARRRGGDLRQRRRLAASSSPPGTRSPRWPTATCCARCWRPCAA